MPEPGASFLGYISRLLDAFSMEETHAEKHNRDWSHANDSSSAVRIAYIASSIWFVIVRGQGTSLRPVACYVLYKSGTAPGRRPMPLISIAAISTLLVARACFEHHLFRDDALREAGSRRVRHLANKLAPHLLLFAQQSPEEALAVFANWKLFVLSGSVHVVGFLPPTTPVSRSW